MPEFPHIEVEGKPDQQGFQYGVALRRRIEEAWGVYSGSMFQPLGLTDQHVISFATAVRDSLQVYSPPIVEIVEGIANGSGVEAWKIYALNARSELMNQPRAECTTLFFPEAGLLGQTWDWIEPLEDLAVTVTWRHESGHEVITFGEPGMVGKIGMNTAGLGICLNFLFAPVEGVGVPLHCVARQALEYTKFPQAKAALQNAGAGKAGHLLLGSASGDSLGVEYTGQSQSELELDGPAYVHTNHFIGKNAPQDADDIPGSRERFERAHSLLGETDVLSLAAMKRILLDKSQGQYSINSDYYADPAMGELKAGTIAAIVMDLGARTLHVKRGNGLEDNYSTFTL